MKFTITDELQTTVERAWALYFDPDFQDELFERLRVESLTEYEFADSPDQLRLSYKVVVIRTLPEWVRKILGDFKVAYTATDVFYKKTNEMHMKMNADPMPNKIYGTGVWSVRESRPGWVTRRYDGDIHIDIPLVGGKMEQKLAQALEGDFATSNRLLEEWVKRDNEAMATGQPLRELRPARSRRG